MAAVVIPLDYDISKATAKQDRLLAEWRKSTVAVEQQREKVAELVKTVEQAKFAIEENNAAYRNGEISLKERDFYNKEALATLDQFNDKYETEKAQMDVLTAKANEKNAALQAELQKQEQITDQARQQTDAVKQTTDAQQNVATVTEHTANAFDKFTKRISNLAKRVLIFSVITKLLRKMRALISEQVSQSEETAEAVDNIKNSLAVMGQMLWNSISPAVKAILQAVSNIMALIAYGISQLTGQSLEDTQSQIDAAKESTDNANDSVDDLTDSVDDLGKTAQKAFAPFDTIQTIDTSVDSGKTVDKAVKAATAATSARQSWDSLLGAISDTFLEISLLGGAALIVIGFALCFTGHVLLGLSLIATGALLVYSSYKALSARGIISKFEEVLGPALQIVGVLMLVIGLLLMSTGHIPLGIFLAVGGAVAFYAGSLMPDGMGIRDKIAEAIEPYFLIFGVVTLLIGLLLSVTGFVPLGIFLIVSSAGLIYRGSQSDKSRDLFSTIYKAIEKYFTAAGVIMLVIGLICCLTGQAPLGCFLISTGAVAIWLDEANLDGSDLKDMLAVALEPLALLGGMGLITVGLIVAAAGDVPHGVALMLLGAAALGAAGYLHNYNNPDLGNIGTYGGGHHTTRSKSKATTTDFSSGKTSFAGNAVLMNKKSVWRFANRETRIDLPIGSYNLTMWNEMAQKNKAAGKHWTDLPKELQTGVTQYRFPAFATGAVIPGGSPFLAVLGDQPKWQTNVETPLSTMIEAFKAAQGQQQITINFSGNLAQLARVLKPAIEQENVRLSYNGG